MGQTPAGSVPSCRVDALRKTPGMSDVRLDPLGEQHLADGADGSFVGLALAFDIDREGRQLELGYVVSPHARGRGVATQALQLLTEWAFSELEALRIALWISATNEASKRVAERVGYRYEGTLRSFHFKQG